MKRRTAGRRLAGALALAESDFVLSADYGRPLDEESARSISLVGFDGEDDVVFIGFDDDQAPPLDGRAAPQPAGRWQSLSDGLPGAVAAAKIVLPGALWRAVLLFISD